MKARFPSWPRWFACALWISLVSPSLLAQEEPQLPNLTIGSKAPALEIEYWLSDGNGKFNPITNFEKGHVYIVEFWATWCGSCVTNMPHMAELQQRYAAKNVQLISVSDERRIVVDEFLRKRVSRGENDQTYADLTSVYCLASDPDRSVYQAYMKGSKTQRTPAAFIVGKTGLIEWIGNPKQIDEPLEQVVEDRWDREAYLGKFQTGLEAEQVYNEVVGLMEAGKWDDASAIVAKNIDRFEHDPDAVAMLEELKFFVLRFRIPKGESSLPALEALGKSAPPEQQLAIEFDKCEILIDLAFRGKKVDLAVSSLNALTDEEESDIGNLHMMARKVYRNAELAKKKAPPELIAAATRAAERAVKTIPDTCILIETLAHLVYAQGDLERAIQLQTEAIRNMGASEKEAEPQRLTQMKEFLEKLKDERGKRQE